MTLHPDKGGRFQAQRAEFAGVYANRVADVGQIASVPRSVRKAPSHRRSNQFSKAIFGTFARLHVMLIVFLALCVPYAQGK